MECIVLAAGSGQRLGPRYRDTPKSLVALDERMLVDYVLRGLVYLSCDPIWLVGGHAFPMLRAYLSQKWPQLRLLCNPDTTPGNLGTLLCAADRVQGDFLICNADHAYAKSIFHLMQRHFAADGRYPTVICDFDRALTTDDMKVALQQGILHRISKSLHPYDGGYVGMTYIPKAAKDAYFALASNVWHAQGERACVEQVLAAWVERGQEIRVCDISGHAWIEIDTLQDLERARQQLRESAEAFSY